MAIPPVSPVNIFFCHAPQDSALQAELEAHLSPLLQIKQITMCSDKNILAGADREQQIEAHLDAANIILILVSADFLASDYWYNIAMARALKRHQVAKCYVIPIILRAVLWEDTPLGKLDVLPVGQKPVIEWPNRDKAWLDVARVIRETVRALLPTRLMSQEDIAILTPTQSSQSGQPSAPVVPPPLVPSPRETRVLPPGPLNQPGQSLSVPPTLFSPKTQQYKQPLMPSTIHKSDLSNQSQRPTRASIPWLSLRVVAIIIVVVVLAVVSTRTIFNVLIVQTPASVLSPTVSASPSIGQTPASTRSPTASTNSPSSVQTIPEDMILICNANCGANIVVTLSSITVGGLLDPTWNFTAKDNDTIKCGLVFSTPYLLDKDTGNNTQGLQNGTRLGIEQEVSPGRSISLSVSFLGSPSKGTFAFSSNLTADCGTLFSGSRSYQTVTIKLV